MAKNCGYGRKYRGKTRKTQKNGKNWGKNRPLPKKIAKTLPGLWHESYLGQQIRVDVMKGQ
ncbi:MAG: hypothetical protein FWF33_00230 [Clostridiales bacterium]|nr:hypothetical protein [Clostridiales bacterium]